MKKIFLTLIIILISFQGAFAGERIYCRTITADDGTGVDYLNDGLYDTNFWYATVQNPVTIKCQLFNDNHIDKIDLYKSSSAPYGSDDYLPSQIKIYGSNDDVTYELLNEYTITTKVSDFDFGFNVITAFEYEYYKVEVFDCQVVGINNNCALTELAFYEDDRILHIMSAANYHELIVVETGFMLFISIIAFFVGFVKNRP